MKLPNFFFKRNKTAANKAKIKAKSPKYAPLQPVAKIAKKVKRKTDAPVKINFLSLLKAAIPMNAKIYEIPVIK